MRGEFKKAVRDCVKQGRAWLTGVKTLAQCQDMAALEKAPSACLIFEALVSFVGSCASL